MRVVQIIVGVAVVWFAVWPGVALGKYSGGSGEPNDPYLIGDVNDLHALAADTNDYDKHFKLIADIDLEPNLPNRQVYTSAVVAPDTDSLSADFQGTAFTGSFDGNGKKIKNLTINTLWTGDDYLGLFGCGSGAYIKDLDIENIDVISAGMARYVGGLCAYSEASTISNCCTTVDISGSAYIGGLCGLSEGSAISNCQAAGNVSGNYHVGGLCGENSGTISSCYTNGKVGGFPSARRLGGLCGKNSGTIGDCYSTCLVTGASLSRAGGLCGENLGIIQDCHAVGDVSGGGYLGGLCGDNLGTISECYASGRVTGESDSWGLGGLCGANSSGTISICHATGEVIVSGAYSFQLGGLCGYNLDGAISDCYSTGEVRGGPNSYSLGGLCGQNSEGTLSECYAVGKVYGGSDSLHLGGLCGSNSFRGTISNCHASASVTGGADAYYLGGLCGTNGGAIGNSYSSGSVSGGNSSLDLGGLCGCNDDGRIINCYSISSVSGDRQLGGLCGLHCGRLARMEDSFWDIEASGISTGYNLSTSDPGTVTNVLGKTTAEMQTESTFTDAGWDFSWDDGDGADWFIQVGEYPILVWQIGPGDIYADGRNNLRDWAVFADWWMRDDCGVLNYYCEWADMDLSGDVGVEDLAELAAHWLEAGIYD